VSANLTLYKIELGFKVYLDMILESILAKLLGLSGHSLSGCYRTILTYKNFTLELRSLVVRGVC